MKTCDICGKPLERWYVDVKMKSGPWADVCLACFETQGSSIGQGVGQLYQLNLTTMEWEKIAG